MFLRQDIYTRCFLLYHIQYILTNGTLWLCARTRRLSVHSTRCSGVQRSLSNLNEWTGLVVRGSPSARAVSVWSMWIISHIRITKSREPFPARSFLIHANGHNHVLITSHPPRATALGVSLCLLAWTRFHRATSYMFWIKKSETKLSDPRRKSG
jgi:hypothetical protein